MNLEQIGKEIEKLQNLLKEAGKNQNSHKKTKEKKQEKPKEKPKEKPELPYSETSNILKEMPIEETISRFGILWKTNKPYSEITSNSIVKFYLDYNIRAYKRWNLPYHAKDIIIDRQVKARNPSILDKSIENRIDEIETRLNKKLKPNGKMTINNIEKRQEFLTEHLEKLEARLNADG